MFFIKKIPLPLVLTLVRLILSPLIIPFLFTTVLPYNSVLGNVFVALIFFLLGITDFFDGYLARKYNQTTVLGRVLDPIADKFLLYGALIGLLQVNKIQIVWVIILLGREFFVMGLRQAALEYSVRLTVSIWGKIKTAFQIICLCVIISNPYHTLGRVGAPWWNGIELVLLMSTAVFSLWSAYRYYCLFARAIIYD